MKFLKLISLHALLCIPFFSSYAAQKPKDVFECAERGSIIELADYFDSTDSSADIINEQCLSLLHVAIQSSKNSNTLETVKFLVAKGANVNLKAMLALKQKKLIRVGMKGTYIDSTPISTPLHYAAMTGKADVVNYLLETGADVNSTHDEHGNTPLHLAAWFNHADCVQILLENNADSSIRNTTAGSTPVHSAAWRDSLESLKILIQHGADITVKNSTGIGNTPLYLAAKAGSTNCLRLLIESLKQSGTLHEQLSVQCSGGPSNIACEVAALQNQMQCYWDLIVAGSDIPSTQFVKECFDYFNPVVKDFIQTKRPAAFTGNQKECGICKGTFVTNNVIASLPSCTLHAFHFECFKHHFVEQKFAKMQKELATSGSVTKFDHHDAKVTLCCNYYGDDKTGETHCLDCPKAQDDCWDGYTRDLERAIKLTIFDPQFEKN